MVDNYNYEQFLRSAIDSALGQTYGEVEVLVVDDGSTDGSRQIIESYRDDVVAVFQDNGGQTSALNAGFAASSGDIVMFLDADDVLYPTAAATAVELMAEPGVARAVWGLHKVDSAGAVLGVMPQGIIPDDPVQVLLHGDPHSVAISPTSSNAWSRAFLETLFPLPEIDPIVGYGSAMADSLMAMASLAFGTTRATTEVHGHYLVHGANDLAARDLYGNMAMHLAILPHHFARLETYVRSRGIEVGADDWKRRSVWFRLQRALAAIESSGAADGQVLMVDDGWRLDVGAPFPAAPFVGRDGEWWGQPATGADAIRELELARCAGARRIAFLWPSFWWLDTFAEFAHHLRTNYRAVADTDDVVIFDLTAQ